METKLGVLSKIRDIYRSGGNIMQFLRDFNSQSKNTLEDILISYDFQAGSYIEFVKKNPEYINQYTDLISAEFQKLNTTFDSILEVGVGEATTLANVVSKIRTPLKNILGFDVSWSRIHYGNKYLREKKITNVSLFAGDLFNIPLADNSVDIVYTSHSLEPNGGKEKEALQELYRITGKYMVLLEPAYELAGAEARKRMETHGYVKNLVGVSKELGYNVIENRLFELCANKLNPTQIIIIEKQKNKSTSSCNFTCPITKTELVAGEGYYFTPEGLLAYPVIKNIPCLLPDNAIVATHLNDF